MLFMCNFKIKKTKNTFFDNKNKNRNFVFAFFKLGKNVFSYLNNVCLKNKTEK